MCTCPGSSAALIAGAVVGGLVGAGAVAAIVLIAAKIVGKKPVLQTESKSQQIFYIYFPIYSRI